MQPETQSIPASQGVMELLWHLRARAKLEGPGLYKVSDELLFQIVAGRALQLKSNSQQVKVGVMQQHEAWQQWEMTLDDKR